MSERYGSCRSCSGTGRVRERDFLTCEDTTTECGACDGTGLSGDAVDYMQREAEKESR